MISAPAGGDQKQFVETLFKEIVRTTTTYPESKKGIDWRRESNEVLRKFGLPAKPPESDPLARQRWEQLVAPPLQMVQASFIPPIGLPDLITFNHRGALGKMVAHHQRSANWSGAYIGPTSGRQILEIEGVWQVPKVRVPVAGQTRGPYRSSTWIGLDGQRRYAHSSLPQIGTAQVIFRDQSGQEMSDYSIWWQWWVRGEEFFPIKINLAVNEAEIVKARITVLSKTHVNFFIRNEVSGLGASFDRPAPTTSLGLQMLISGSTAEWVTERPTEFFSPKLFPLPDYRQVLFSGCAATEGKLGTVERVERSLIGAKYIYMYEHRTEPPSTRNISIAARLSDTSFKTLSRVT